MASIAASSSGSSSWLTPIQTIAALSAAWNSGASAQPSWLAMPMLLLESVPAVHSGKQIRFLLHRSEFVFPRINAACTVTNLVLAVLAFRNRGAHSASAAKSPVLVAAFACNVAATAWSILIMVPINNQIRNAAVAMEKDEEEEEKNKKGGVGGSEAALGKEREYRALVQKWSLWAVGRAILMMAAAAAGVYATYLDAFYTLTVA